MRRQESIIFALLLVVAAVPFFLNDRTRLALSGGLSSVLLYPARVTGAFLEYLNVSGARIQRLETHLSQLHLENARLRDKLDVDTTTLLSPQFVFLKARVIGRDPHNINGYLHIDKGMAHGVAPDQPVIAVDGFVGKVKHAEPATSIIETIENDGFTVSAVDERSGIHGVVRKKDHLTFMYVRHTDQIAIGDSIITSGMSEIYPKGIVLGTVELIMESNDMFFKDIFVRPAVQINRLASVYVITGTTVPAPGR